MNANHEEKQYIEHFWGSERNYLEFLSKLPHGVHPVPIHSLGLLHLSCENKETLEAALIVSPDLWGYMEKGFRILSIGTRYVSTRPAKLEALIAIKNQLDPPQT